MNVSNKIFFSFFVFLMVSCKAQTLPLNTPLWDIPANSYVKDLNNELTPYVGTYRTIYQGNEIILYITFEANKLRESSKKTFYRDALVIKYIVKSSSGQVLQDTYNMNSPNNRFYSIGTNPAQNNVDFMYSGTNCNVGWGTVYLSKINANQISWDYIPNHITLTSESCPGNPDLTIYLPETKNLIFTKQ